jgi:hypothetical protein
MTRKHFIILLLLVLVIGGVGVTMFKQDTEAWKGPDARLGQKALPNLQVSDIAHIHIKYKKEELNLVNDNGTWGIKERSGFPADPALISELTFKARDWKIVQSEPISEAQRPRLDLAAPDAAENAATLLELRGKDGKPLASLLLGKKHLGKPPLQVKGFDKGQPDGRYVIVGTDPKTVLVVADPMNNVEPKPEKWIAKEFARVDKVKRLAVEGPDPSITYTLTRENERGDYVLAGLKPGEKTDVSAAITATNALYQLAFVDVTNLKPEQLDKGVKVTAETFDGLTYAMRIMPVSGDDAHMYLSIALTGEPVKTERVPFKDETPEDKAKRDKEHEEAFKRLVAQVAREKTLDKWVYKVEVKTLGALARSRERFIEQPEKPAPAPAKK